MKITDFKFTGAGYHILRIGLGITFIWIAVMIYKDPALWGSLLKPWALELIPYSLNDLMVHTAILDGLLGVLMLLNIGMKYVGLVASLHLIVVLTTAGITFLTVRDIGILAGTLALFLSALPDKHTLKG